VKKTSYIVVVSHSRYSLKEAKKLISTRKFDAVCVGTTLNGDFVFVTKSCNEKIKRVAHFDVDNMTFIKLEHEQNEA